VRVAVLAGGRSSEHEISLASAEAVRGGLEGAGHETLAVNISRDGTWSSDGRPVALEPAQGLLGADVAFPVLHGPFGEDGTVQGLLELLDVPYVGAGVLASAVCMDKLIFKELMGRAGVPQVDYAAFRQGDDPIELRRLGMPVFVKPARLGSSVGISKVSATDELEPALRAAFDHDPLVIVEAAAGGIEVECSVLGNSRPVASQPGRILVRAASSDWYDYEAKYEPGGMELQVPAEIPDVVRERVRDLATEVFIRVGCSGMARVDFFVEDDRVLVNELNTMPGFTQTSVFPKLWEASGVPFPGLCDRLLALALERHAAERGTHRF
jgi:D-alanine-D-alanine ligase